MLPMPKLSRCVISVIIAVLICAADDGIKATHPNSLAPGSEYYASPDGHGVFCTKPEPCSLTFAISNDRTPLRPGDTLWLRGGTYHGTFTSNLHGTAASPITVRQVPGERAVIDGGNSNGRAIFTIKGAYTRFWGFEVMSSDPIRISSQRSPWPTDIPRGEGVLIDQSSPHPGLKLINMSIHDTRQGISFWKEAQDGELYGNMIYNNGWDGPDRGHGHGIYVQNQSGVKRIVDNIIFHQFSHGIQAYGSRAAQIDNLYFEGNTLFDSGAPSIFGMERNVLIGGGSIAHNITFIKNCTYGAKAKFGYSAPVEGLKLLGNYLPTAVEMNATKVIMKGNTYLDSTSQMITGFSPDSYPANTYLPPQPVGVDVIIRPNAYEPGRATIVIYNWDKKRSVAVDLSSVLKSGDSFEIRDVQNYLAAPIARGTHTGRPITLRMESLHTAVQPIGVSNRITHTGIDFGVFIVTRRTKDGIT
jgi:hypothetical protein